MGNVEQIEQLESFIEDLGNEVNRVKKASEYISLIEKFQKEVTLTSSSLNQTKEQLKVHQEITENKLELFHSSSRNIEAKQQGMEMSLGKIAEVMNEVKLKVEKNADEQDKALKTISAKNSRYFIVGLTVNIVIGGVLIYLVGI